MSLLSSSPAPSRGVDRRPRSFAAGSALRRGPISRESLSRTASAPGYAPDLPDRLQTLWDATARQSRELAAELRCLDASWLGRGESGETSLEADAEDLRVALALRCTRGQAARRIREAHLALAHLPRAVERLERGELPVPWFRRALTEARGLPPERRPLLDQALASWSLDVTSEQFARRLNHVVARLAAVTEMPREQCPESRRRVELVESGTDGMGCVQVFGPIPEVLEFSRRLDSAARAAQAVQRRALENGGPLPLDWDGTAREEGRTLTLAELRYNLVTGSALELEGVEVPSERFRISVTVPALTLLGLTEEPGTLDGTIPLPPNLARQLAGSEGTWYRVLTDPATGAFLPLPARRYAPSPEMLEHLRLRNATCAAPGCTRSSSWAAQCDHIEEYSHRDPESGGRTEIENLHMLCWQHHQAKTAGLIDPVRESTVDHRRSTTWRLTEDTVTRTADDEDLATPAMVTWLNATWREFRERRAQRARRAEELARQAEALARLAEQGLAPGSETTGPDGQPGWVVAPDGTLRAPPPPPPF